MADELRNTLVWSIISSLDNEVVDETADDPLWWVVTQTSSGHIQARAVTSDGDVIENFFVEIR